MIRLWTHPARVLLGGILAIAFWGMGGGTALAQSGEATTVEVEYQIFSGDKSPQKAREMEPSRDEEKAAEQAERDRKSESSPQDRHVPWFLWAMGGLAGLVLIGGFANGLRTGGKHV